jgi:DNA-binding MarR family transcriptional regulator
MENLSNLIFYSLDQSIRTYRQFAQHQLKKHGFDMTVDQWIVMTCIVQNPEITQMEIAERVFKDTASVTRIITLLVKANYLTRKVMRSNRRRVILKVTPLGLETLAKMQEVIAVNRTIALKGLDATEIDLVQRIADKITHNLKSNENS